MDCLNPAPVEFGLVLQRLDMNSLFIIPEGSFHRSRALMGSWVQLYFAGVSVSVSVLCVHYPLVGQ